MAGPAGRPGRERLTGPVCRTVAGWPARRPVGQVQVRGDLGGQHRKRRTGVILARRQPWISSVLVAVGTAERRGHGTSWCLPRQRIGPARATSSDDEAVRSEGLGRRRMGTSQVEIERKYDVAADAAVPPLAGVGPVTGVDEPVTRAARGGLPRHGGPGPRPAGVTLRRRVGGQDSGWHLKRPVTKADKADKKAGGTARSELHEPLGPDDEPVPSTLLEEVRALVRHHPVEPVVTLSTRRVVRRLRDARRRRPGRARRRHGHRAGDRDRRCGGPRHVA